MSRSRTLRRVCGYLHEGPPLAEDSTMLFKDGRRSTSLSGRYNGTCFPSAEVRQFQAWWPDSRNGASGEPGAVQTMIDNGS